MPTKIEWATDSWNPITGCTPISEGCANCYAKRMARRQAGRFGYPKNHPFQPVFHQDKLWEPRSWRKSRRVFVCSMGDLFHEDVQFSWIDDVFTEITLGYKHVFILLTKRPERVSEYHKRQSFLSEWEWPKNAWLGVTAENQKLADERIPILLAIPAAVRFVSIEPMLSRVDLGKWINRCPKSGRVDGPLHSWKFDGDDPYITCHWCGEIRDAITGRIIGAKRTERPLIDWVICGAETGPKKRPMDLDWAESLRYQCVSTGVPFFFKKDSNGNHELDGRVWEELPK